MSSHRRGFTPRPVHVAPSRDFAFPSVLSSAREQIVVDRSGGRSDEWSCKENEMNYTIDIDNNIQAHAVAPATQDKVVAFTTEKGLANALGECGINRLVEIWNSFAGAPPFGDLKPVKKFENRRRAISRIWTAIQKLDAAPAPAPQPARKAKPSKTATANGNAPQGTVGASAAGVPRAFSKQNIVRDMLVRPGGATLEEIMKITSWQKHSVRGFISTQAKKTGMAITSTRREIDKARVYEATK
jgi:hypothetical protein